MTVGLLGVTGFTGSLIAKELMQQGIDFLPAGRNRELFEQLFGGQLPQMFYVNLDEPYTLKDFLSRVDVVVNCIGPFNLFGHKVLDAVFEMGNKIYADITGEQQFILNSFQHRQELARQKNVTVTHSVAFESFLIDLVAQNFLNQSAQYKDIETYYHVEKGVLSGGSRFTMRLSSFYRVYRVQNGQLIEAKPFELSRDVNLPFVRPGQKFYFVPYPEIILFNFTYRAENINSFYLSDEFEAGMFQSPKSQDFNRIIQQEQSRKRRFYPESYRKKEKFYILLHARDTDDQQYNYLVTGYDTYGLTAQLMSQFIAQILNRNNLPSGVFTPAQLVDHQQVLANLPIEITQPKNLNIK